MTHLGYCELIVMSCGVESILTFPSFFIYLLLLHRDIMNNKVFYQHPNLMRALGMHETVMEVMVNVLGEGESKVRLIKLYIDNFIFCDDDSY